MPRVGFNGVCGAVGSDWVGNGKEVYLCLVDNHRNWSALIPSKKEKHRQVGVVMFNTLPCNVTVWVQILLQAKTIFPIFITLNDTDILNRAQWLNL